MRDDTKGPHWTIGWYAVCGPGGVQVRSLVSKLRAEEIAAQCGDGWYARYMDEEEHATPDGCQCPGCLDPVAWWDELENPTKEEL